MITVDSLLTGEKEYRDIDLIKIDVEGYEMEVLKGAKEILETQFQIALLLIFLPPICQSLVVCIKTNLAT